VGLRHADIDLDAGLVAELVADQFPELAGSAVRRLGAGDDNDLFTVGGEWILRFPKRAGQVPWLVREVEIMAVVAQELGAVVPRFELTGQPSRSFPYPFVGYRLLPGIGADRNAALDEAGLAEDVGLLLSRLHRIDPGRIPPTPAGWEKEPWSTLRDDLTAIAVAARPLLEPGLLAEAEPYLAGRVPEPPQDAPRRFIHNDICPDHLLTDPRTGRLTGLIDFTDAMVGDVVYDFVGLIGLGGYRFTDRVAAVYDLPLGDNFQAQLEWLARTLTLTWLAEAAAGPAADIAKHLSWVACAFGG